MKWAAKSTMPGSDDRIANGRHGHLSDDLIFSLIDGYVWVSWPGTVASVKLGANDTVRALMRDFLAQCEQGDRLTNARTGDE
jgi:hypothetical protein